MRLRPSCPSPRPGQRCKIRGPRSLLIGAAVAASLLPGCARFRERGPSAEGARSEGQRNRYVSRAIRSSSEGFILMPSSRAERVYELPRLNEIAHDMRGPAAACFLNRAIKTMKRGDEDGRVIYTDVPEGQVKIRARIASDGKVMRTEVLESGFSDEKMEPCISEVVASQRWPENQDGHLHYVDVIYWVSLGAQREVDSREFAQRLKREQIEAGMRAKQCLRGRVEPGTYAVEGLSLMSREGTTLVSRVENNELQPEVAGCVAQALKTITISRDSDAFVRPISPRVSLRVDEAGEVAVDGEEWLELVRAEEEAKRRARQAGLRGDAAPAAAPGSRAPAQEVDPPAVLDEGPPVKESPAPQGDPAKGGHKLRLTGQRGND